MPPTLSRGETAIAVTMMPMPPSHCSRAAQSRMPEPCVEAGEHGRARGGDARNRFEHRIRHAQVDIRKQQQRQRRECRKHHPAQHRHQEGLPEGEIAVQLGVRPHGAADGDQKPADEEGDRRADQEDGRFRLGPAVLDCGRQQHGPRQPDQEPADDEKDRPDVDHGREPPLSGSTPTTRAVEREGRNVYLEPFAVLAHHLVAAGHEAGGRRQRRAAGIGEALARLQHGLLADNAGAAHLLGAAERIGDSPIARNQLHGAIALIGDLDVIRPEIAPFRRDRSGLPDIRPYAHTHPGGRLLIHFAVLPRLYCPASVGPKASPASPFGEALLGKSRPFAEAFARL